VVGSTEYFKRDTGIGAITDVGEEGGGGARRRCIGGSGARTFDKTRTIIHPEVMFSGCLSRTLPCCHPSECLNLFGRRLARSIRTFKLWSMRVGEVEGGWKDSKVSFVFLIL
jgi:hypothetical protein